MAANSQTILPSERVAMKQKIEHGLYGNLTQTKFGGEATRQGRKGDTPTLERSQSRQERKKNKEMSN